MPGLDVSKLKKDLINERWYVDLKEHIIDLAWSPNSALLVAATVEGRIILIENQGNAAFFKQVGQHSMGANSVSFSSTGDRFASCGQDGCICVYQSSTGETLQTLKSRTSWIGRITYQPLDNRNDPSTVATGLLAAAVGKSLIVYDIDGKPIYQSDDHASTIADIAWNPKGDTIAVAAYNGLTLHKPNEKSPPRKYSWQGSSLIAAWSPDERFIATGEQDATVHFWMVDSGEHAQMWGFPTKVLQLSWDRTGKWLATGGGSSVVLWDCSGKGPMGRQPELLECHVNKITALAYEPTGDFLVSTDGDGLLCVWNPQLQKELLGGKSLTAAGSCIRWTSTGDLLAVGQDDGIVVVFSAPKLS